METLTFDNGDKLTHKEMALLLWLFGIIFLVIGYGFFKIFSVFSAISFIP